MVLTWTAIKYHTKIAPILGILGGKLTHTTNRCGTYGKTHDH